MELRHLRYFLAVAEHQGFRKAAQTLRISHPSLCEQIMDLEKEVGTPLFDRTNHHVCLTAAGHTFLVGARKTLKCSLQTIEMTRQASRGHCGELRIANIGLMCSALLARLIRAFRERFPNVQVSILQQNNFEGIETVLERVELGIGYLGVEATRRPVGTFTSWVIATAPIGIAVATTVGHDARSAAKLQDFAQEPFLILDPKYAPGYLGWVRSIFLQTGFEPAQTIPVDSAEGFFTLICAGAGVALLSPLHFDGQREGVCFRRLTEPVAEFPLSLVWDAQRASPLVENFLGVVRQVLPNPNGALRADDLSRFVSAVVNGS